MKKNIKYSIINCDDHYIPMTLLLDIYTSWLTSPISLTPLLHAQPVAITNLYFVSMFLKENEPCL